MNKKKKHSILIIDDEKSDFITLSGILGNEYKIFAVRDSRTAVQVAEKEKPDIILLDIIMPEVDGYEVIASLKDSDKTRDIPVIFISGLDNTSAEEKGLGLGAADFLHKPFISSIVKVRIKNQIKLINQVKQQALVARISSSFLSVNYLEPLFQDTLRTVGEFMGIARLSLYKFENKGGGDLICLSEWAEAEHSLEARKGTKFLLNATMLSIIKNLLSVNKGDLYISSNNPFFKEEMRQLRENLRNFIIVPVYIKGKLAGVLDFSREDDGHEWTQSELSLALLVSGVFSAALERDVAEKQFSIVEKAPVSVFSITADAVVQYANSAVLTATGFTPDEVLVGGLKLVFGTATSLKIKEKYIPLAMRGETAEFETESERKDGKKAIFANSVFNTGKNTLGIISRDLTEIRQLETENQKVYYDGLTNMYNRRYFDETAEEMLKSLSANRGTLAMIMVDIDFFKNYNDMYGHSAGDDCLRAVADILKKTVAREGDFVARYGGEEFVIVLPSTDEAGVRTVAQKLLTNIRECKIPHKKSYASSFVTVSAGATVGKVKPTHTVVDFVKLADEMLYRSKQTGRNKYEFGGID
ncbi:MAG: diguanylate cyclase [Firmicutes bacterium]|nr:diguanylate cyclase [Bacillota bacterium]